VFLLPVPHTPLHLNIFFPTRATTAVDQLCHTIVYARSIKDVEISSQIRDLGLTVAVFERSIVAYAKKLNRTKNEPTYRHSPKDSRSQAVTPSFSPLSTGSPRKHSFDLTLEDTNALLRSNTPVLTPFSFNHNNHHHNHNHDGTHTRSQSAFNPIINTESKLTGSRNQTPPLPYSPANSPPQTPGRDSPSTPRGGSGVITPIPIRSHSDPVSVTALGIPRPRTTLPRSRLRSGGMVALLQILADTLNKTNDTLNSLRFSVSYWSYFVNLVGIGYNDSVLALNSSISKAAFLGGASLLLLVSRRRIFKFMRICYALFHRVFVSRVLPLRGARFAVYLRNLFYENRSVGLRGFILAALIYVLNWIHRRAVRTKVQALRKLRGQLMLMLRLWHVCISVMDEIDNDAAGSRGGPGGQSNADDTLNNSMNSRAPSVQSQMGNMGGGAQIAISHWMLELCPPSLNSAFWYESSFRLTVLKYGLDVVYCSTSFWYNWFGLNIVGAPAAFLATLYYMFHPVEAASTCSALFASPDMRLVIAAWGVMDCAPMRWWSRRALNKLKVVREIELVSGEDVAANVFFSEPYEDSSNMMSRRGSFKLGGAGGGGGGGSGAQTGLGMVDVQYDEDGPYQPVNGDGIGDSTMHGGVNEIMPYQGDQGYEQDLQPEDLVDDGVDGGGGWESVPHPLTVAARSSAYFIDVHGTATDNKPIKVLLLSQSPLNMMVNKKIRRNQSLNMLGGGVGAAPFREKGRIPLGPPLVIYHHGGGLVTSFTASDMKHMAQFAEVTECPILYIDYSLAPEHAYPKPMEECYDVYRWVVDGRLGFKPSKIILAGDSSGGHLAVATCIRAITDADSTRIPDGLVLAYPTLNLSLRPSTSRAIFMMDPVAPMNLLKQCTSMYLPSHLDLDGDPCASPLLASDELLSQFPPTSVMCGSFDPFLDDSVDFVHPPIISSWH